MLVAAGFSAPVMTWRSSRYHKAGEALLEDLRASGQASARATVAAA